MDLGAIRLALRRLLGVPVDVSTVAAGYDYFVFLGRRLLHLLDFSGLPGLVEPRLERTVEAKDRVPAFARNGLHPVGMACWRRRAEPDVHRSVGVDDDVFLLTADGRELLVGLKFRSRLVVVNDE